MALLSGFTTITLYLIFDFFFLRASITWPFGRYLESTRLVVGLQTVGLVVLAVATVAVLRRRLPVPRRSRLQAYGSATAHAVAAVVFVLLVEAAVWPGMDIDAWFDLTRRLEKKVSVYLPRWEHGVGRPPDDGKPEIVFALEVDDGVLRAAIAGRRVDSAPRGMREAFADELRRRSVQSRDVRVRFDVGPEVSFQSVIHALDAVLYAGVKDGWYSGVAGR